MSYSPLHPEFTEHTIRDALDGTFTRFDPVTGGVRTSVVGEDHRPSHDISGSHRGVLRPAAYKHYSQAEDEMIISMKLGGYSCKLIGILLGRDDAGVAKRYRTLVRSGKCQAVVS
jgi:hypothetical protein